jgi:hypothetical protein
MSGINSLKNKNKGLTKSALYSIIITEQKKRGFKYELLLQVYC